MKIGKAIKKARLCYFKGNQIEFSKAIGISQTYLSQIENDKKEPSVSVLNQISLICEIPLAILMWFTIDTKDIAENKKDAFKFLKPSVDAMLKEIFETE